MAGDAGLEPANAGVKVPCLTDLANPQYIRGLASPLHVPALYYILLYLRFFSDDSTSLGSFFSDEAREMGFEPTFARATIWCFTN